MAIDFERYFIGNGKSVVDVEAYSVGHPETLPGLLPGVWKTNPDLIYFAGYDDDVGHLVAALPTTGLFAQVQVLGGEALYPTNTYNNVEKLHFTAFAHPDEWLMLSQGDHRPAFFAEYADNFDPHREHKDDPHGYTLTTTNTMLSYDATLALLEAINLTLERGKEHISSEDVQQGLTRITSSHSLQGSSGIISFGSDGNPVNKLILLLSINQNGNVKLDFTQGDLWHP